MQHLNKICVFFLLATVALWLNFSGHILSTLPLGKFLDGEFPSERYVFSRLIYDLKHGTDSQGGFMLRYEHADDLYGSTLRDDYADFKKRLEAGEDKTEIYLSHAGFQDDLVFPLWQGLSWVKAKVLERADPDSRWHERLNTLDLYYFNMIAQVIVALLNALALSLFALWVARNFSVRAGWVFLGLTILTLPALGFFGRSLWWMMWSWFAPMLVTLWALHVKGGRYPGLAYSALAGIFAGAAIALKTLMGYEFLAPIMVAALTPVALYAVWRRWGWLNWFKASSIIGAFCLAGAAYAVLLHWQALENFGLDPLQAIRERFEMRSHGGDSVGQGAGALYESTRASFWGVFLSYLISTKELAVPQILLMLPFLLWLRRYRGERKSMEQTNKSLADAFAVTILIGFLGGVSMLAILKGHAYVHGFDVVIWCIPLNLFLLAFYAWRITQPSKSPRLPGQA